MCDPDSQGSKVYYRPIEAAIRWCGQLSNEKPILEKIGCQQRSSTGDFPEIPSLQLYVDRIFDAMINQDLPYGKDGVTMSNPALLNCSDVTVRHVDLKIWMTRFYPDQKPEFLFDEVERSFHPAISVDTVQILLAGREALIQQLADRTNAWEISQADIEAMHREHDAMLKNHLVQGAPSARSEGTYLNIVGGLLGLLLGQSPSGKPYSSFVTMEAIIDALLAHNEGRPGMSERTLWAKLAQAKRHREGT